MVANDYYSAFAINGCGKLSFEAFVVVAKAAAAYCLEIPFDSLFVWKISYKISIRLIVFVKYSFIILLSSCLPE